MEFLRVVLYLTLFMDLTLFTRNYIYYYLHVDVVGNKPQQRGIKMKYVDIEVSGRKFTNAQAIQFMGCIAKRQHVRLNASNVFNNTWHIRFSTEDDSVSFSIADCIGYNSYTIMPKDITFENGYLCINGMQINVEKAN